MSTQLKYKAGDIVRMKSRDELYRDGVYSTFSNAVGGNVYRIIRSRSSSDYLNPYSLSYVETNAETGWACNDRDIERLVEAGPEPTESPVEIVVAENNLIDCRAEFHKILDDIEFLTPQQKRIIRDAVKKTNVLEDIIDDLQIGDIVTMTDKRDASPYMLVRIDGISFCFIDLCTGNRWANPSTTIKGASGHIHPIKIKKVANSLKEYVLKGLPLY